MIKALLASDDDLRRHQAKAYQTAINGTWPDRIGTGDALALFLTAAIQARAIQEGSRFPIRGFFLMVEQSARRHRGPSSRFQVAIRWLDANGQSLAYVYGRETRADADIANVYHGRGAAHRQQHRQIAGLPSGQSRCGERISCWEVKKEAPATGAHRGFGFHLGGTCDGEGKTHHGGYVIITATNSTRAPSFGWGLFCFAPKAETSSA